MSDRPNLEDTSESLALVTKLARKRREQAQTRVLEQPPDFIIDVLHASASYGFHPSALPFEMADFNTFRKKLEDEYRLKFVVPEVVPQLVDQVSEGSSGPIDQDRIGEFLFQSDDPEALFEKGRLDMGKRQIVQIQTVLLSIEQVSVKVRGKTDAAELLIKDVVQFLWAAAGFERTWEEIEPKLQVKSYKTSTRVRIGFPPETLFSDTLNGFLAEQVIGGARYGRQMGRLSDRDNFNPPSQSTEAFMLDEVQIRVSRHDETSRRDSAEIIRIGIGRRDLYGSDVIDCNTALPFDKHCDFVSAFIDACK